MFRTAVFASVMAPLGLAGHSLADGSIPGGASIALVIAASLALSMPAVSKRRTVLWAFLYLVGAQALIHVILSFSHVSHGYSSPWSMVLFHVGAAAIASIVLIHLDHVIESFIEWGRGILGILLPLPAIPCGHLAITHRVLPASVDITLKNPSTRAPPVHL